MVELIAPLGLLGLLGAAIPLAIHLWRRRSPRTQLVGSLQFLVLSRPSRFHSWSLSQVTLLVVRLLLVCLLSLLLAEPAWRRARAGFVGQRRILVSPVLLDDWRAGGARYALDEVGFESAIETLVEDGWELRRFEPGFPAHQLGEEVAGRGRSESYWSLLRAADLQVPGSTLWVFTPDLVGGLAGQRPRVSATVHWQAIPARESERWIEGATFDGDTAVVTVGSSSRQATRFSRQRLPRQVASDDSAGDPPSSDLRLTQIGGDWFVELAGEGVGPHDRRRQVDGRPLRVAVLYGDGREEDAGYVHAAVSALADTICRPVSTSLAALSEVGRHLGADVVFCLAAEPLDDGIRTRVQQGMVLVADGGASDGDFAGEQTWIPFAGRTEPLRLRRRSPPTPSGVILWEDSRAEPLLTLHREGRGCRLEFASRFHPRSSDLVMQPYFPDVIWWLMSAKSRRPDVEGRDLRGADASQFLPQAGAASLVPPPRVSLLHPLWAAALLIFVLERGLAQKAGV